MTASADIVNRALQQIAAQATVSGGNPTFDGSAAGNAAGILYMPVVKTLLRSQDWEFARREWIGTTVPLSLPPVINPWSFVYDYPADCERLLQVWPANPSAFDPQPVRWSVAEIVVTVGLGTAPAKGILTNQAAAALTYTSNSVIENGWDSIFAESVVRLLASELAMALGGRPDFSEKMLATAGQLASSGPGKDS
ncbi:MAG: hypothetical protein ABI196_00610 [Bradyrhizobium sp.]